MLENILLIAKLKKVENQNEALRQAIQVLLKETGKEKFVMTEKQTDQLPRDGGLLMYVNNKDTLVLQSFLNDEDYDEKIKKIEKEFPKQNDDEDTKEPSIKEIANALKSACEKLEKVLED